MGRTRPFRFEFRTTPRNLCTENHFTRPRRQFLVFTLGCVSAGAVSIGAPGAVLAQSVDDANPVPKLEELVVTSRREVEQLQSVPLSVSAFSQADIEKYHISQVSDLAQLVPSLSYNQFDSDPNGFASGQTRLRGLPGTVVYFADVPVASTDQDPTTSVTHGTSAGSYYDLDDVEVIKGPQGTLFGKNSIGGLISIEPKKPDSEYEGYIEGGVGNYGDRQLEGAVNLPLVPDKVLLRVAGQSQVRDGYTKDITSGVYYDDRNYYSWRIGLLFRATSHVENYLLFDSYNQDSHGSSDILIRANPSFVLGEVPLGPLGTLPLTLGAGPAVSGLYASNPLPTIVAGLQTGSLSLFPTVGAALSEQQALGPRAFAGAATPGVGRDLFYGVTNTTIYTPAENLIFKNIAAIRVTKELSSIDYSDTGLGILTLGGGTNTGWNEDSIQYTNELQIQGRAFQRLSWIAGSFLSLNQPLKATNEPSIQLGTEDFYHFHNNGSSEAAFIHGIYDFGDYVHGLHMSAGYRYTFDQVSIHEFGYKGVDMVQAAAGGAPTNCAPIIFNDSCDAGANAHFSSPGWNLGLDEQVNKTALVYVRSGNAYRPGNVNPEAPASYQLVKPEHVTDVEVGAKLDWRVLGGRARLNGDLYYTKYKSIQVVQDVSVPDPNNPDAPPTVAAVATNNAMAYLAGTEVETTWRSPQGFEINAHASYIYSHYNQYPALFYATQVPPFLFEPAWQYGATATYHLPLPRSAGDVSVAGTYAFTGREFAAANTADSNNVIASHDNSNIRIDWITPFQPNLETSLVITNVFNKVYITSIAALYDVIGITSASYDEPRMVVFYVKYRFGPYR